MLFDNQSKKCFICLDISLFDELDGLGDAEELLQALASTGYVSQQYFHSEELNKSESLGF